QFEQQDCGHKEDVGVVCSEHKLLRLSEGCSGHTEVYYNGSWGSVCFNQMEKTTVAVICRQLGCGHKGTVDETISRLSPDPKWLDNVVCQDYESSLWQCPSSPWGQNQCTETEVADIRCSGNLPLRLTGGSDPCSGRVEVYHKGFWGTVCDDSWDLQDAMVVCRQLDCGAALRAEKGSRFERGNGPIWLDEVNCRGSELYLWHCSYSPQQSSCSHKQDAGVTCAALHRGSNFGQSDGSIWSKYFQCEGHESFLHECLTSDRREQNRTHEVQLNCQDFLRLVGGADCCSGRLEVKFNQSWATVPSGLNTSGVKVMGPSCMSVSPQVDQCRAVDMEMWGSPV
ncbi:hypothetical protein Z043_123888, partial [Scleropages formosus]